MLRITPIAILQDNYVWLLEHNQQTLIVDPGEAQPVLDYLEQHNLKLDYIFVTHKHWDHVTGIEAIKAAFPDSILYGTGHFDIPCRDIALLGGESLELMGLNWKVWHTPGHTLDHIVFHTQTQEDNGVVQDYVFSGDNIFACGCGRMFEGTAQQFHHSLQSLMALPLHTKLYCTHEYTLANINFALHIEPNNTYTLHRQDVSQSLRNNAQPTLPTTVADELKSNPFVRCDQPDVIRAAEHFSGKVMGKPEEVFAVIRQMKDQF
ncbi:MAG: hydroxyacylglutathione hydrolase [Gammaproteobacteria bacterium]|nr:hydroxyacylglutathione hydrolase [Gammaproteobacteria bacterium]